MLKYTQTVYKLYAMMQYCVSLCQHVAYYNVTEEGAGSRDSVRGLIQGFLSTYINDEIHLTFTAITTTKTSLSKYYKKMSS